MKQLARLLGIAFVIASFAQPASADSKYPDRQIQVVVPYTPGELSTRWRGSSARR